MLVFLPASACNQRIIPQRRTTCGRCEALHVIRYEKCAALIEKITQGGLHYDRGLLYDTPTLAAYPGRKTKNSRCT